MDNTLAIKQNCPQKKIKKIKKKTTLLKKFKQTRNCHPPVHHPLDARYYSVVNKPQLELIFGFTLVTNCSRKQVSYIYSRQIGRKIGSKIGNYQLGNWNPTENYVLTTYHSSYRTLYPLRVLCVCEQGLEFRGFLLRTHFIHFVFGFSSFFINFLIINQQKK